MKCKNIFSYIVIIIICNIWRQASGGRCENIPKPRIELGLTGPQPVVLPLYYFGARISSFSRCAYNKLRFPLAMELLKQCRTLIAERIAKNEALPVPNAREAADLETEMQKNRLLIGLVEKVRLELE